MVHLQQLMHAALTACSMGALSKVSHLLCEYDSFHTLDV